MRFHSVSFAVVAIAIGFLSAVSLAQPTSRPTSQPAGQVSWKLERPIRVLAIGDPQYPTEAGFVKWGRQLADARDLKPDFAIPLGDLTAEGTADQFKWYKAAIAQAGYPVHSLPGNHDVGDNGNRPENYMAALGDLNYTFDFGGVKFICFNMNKPDKPWLANALAAAQGHPIIVAQHAPPNAKTISQWKAAGTIAVLTGHIHASRRNLADGVWDINAPKAETGFVVLDLLPDGRLNAMFRPADTHSLRLLHPSGPVPAGQTRLLADVFDTGTDMAGVEFDAGDGWKPMKQVGWRSWEAQTNLTKSVPVRLKATPLAATTQPWQSDEHVTVQPGDVPAVRADDDWPVWGHTSRNDRSLARAVPGALAAEKSLLSVPRLAWWTNIDGHCRDGAPIVVGGRVYVVIESQSGPTDNALVCLDATTGKEKWRRQLPGSPTGAAAFCRGVVAVATLDNAVYGFDAESGRPMWNTTTRGMYNTYGLYGRITADADLFYVGNLTAHEPQTGKTLWTAAAAQSAYGTPAIGEGFIVGFGGYGSYLLRQSDHSIVWKHSRSTRAASIILPTASLPPYPPTSRPAATRPGDEAEAIFVDTGRIRLADQFAIWTNKLVLTGGCLAGDRMFVIRKNGPMMAAISLATGEVLWQKGLPKGFEAGVPAAVGNIVYFTASDGRLHVVDTLTGDSTAGPAVCWPGGDVTPSGNALFVAGSDGNVICFVTP